MVYTIRFNEDKAPAYSQATSSNINETNEIQKEDVKTTSKKTKKYPTSENYCLGGLFVIILSGMFKSSLYLYIGCKIYLKYGDMIS